MTCLVNSLILGVNEVEYLFARHTFEHFGC